MECTCHYSLANCETQGPKEEKLKGVNYQLLISSIYDKIDDYNNDGHKVDRHVGLFMEIEKIIKQTLNP